MHRGSKAHQHTTQRFEESEKSDAPLLEVPEEQFVVDRHPRTVNLREDAHEALVRES